MEFSVIKTRSSINTLSFRFFDDEKRVGGALFVVCRTSKEEEKTKFLSIWIFKGPRLLLEEEEEEEEEDKDVVKSYENATRATRATTRFFYIFLSAFLRIKTALYSKKFQYRLFILLLLLLCSCSWPLLRTSPLPR